MELKDLLQLIYYDSKGESFKDCSAEEMKQILEDYYLKGKSLVKIIETYNLNPKNKNKLRKDFPKLSIDTECEYDGNKMFLDIPSKESLKYFSLDNYFFECLECGHTNKESCMCENCKKTYRSQIYALYSSTEKVDLEVCTLSDRILLGSVLQGLHANSIDKAFGPYEDFENKRNPIFTDGFSKLEQLIDKRIIVVSTDSQIASFSIGEDFPNRYFPIKVNWKLNVTSEKIVDDESLFDYLKYPNAAIVNNQKEVEDIWRDLVLDELIRLFNYQIEDLDFNYKHDNDKDKVRDLLIRLLETLTPAQIYELTWIGVRKANTSRTRKTWGHYKFNPIDFVIKNIEELLMKKTNNGDEIKGYDYPDKLTPLLCTKIFFNQVALLPNWFILKAPISNVDKNSEADVQEIDFYEKLSNEEKHVFDEEFFEFEYYYLTDFGIIAFDGCVSWLFSDEKTLYRMSKFVKKSNYPPAGNEFYSHFDIPYFINETYSTVYLFSLMKFLKKAKVPYHFPEMDEEFVSYAESELK